MPWTTPGTATAGNVLTAAFWNTNVRDNTNELYGSMRRLGIQTRGTYGDGSVNFFTVSATSFASSAEVFSSDVTWTADGTSAYVVDFYCPMAIMGSANNGVQAAVCTGSGTVLGVVGEVYNASAVTASTIFGRMFYTPAAGSASVNVRAKIPGGASGTLRFGGEYVGGYLAVYGPNIT